MNIQKSLGMPIEEINGEFTSNTVTAVKEFQKVERETDPFMQVDGMAGNYTKWRLYHSERDYMQ